MRLHYRVISSDYLVSRIQDMAKDINDLLIEKLKSNDFVIQLDEATDSHNDVHIIYYARLFNVFHDGLIFCKNIDGESKAADLFKILDSFMIKNNIV